jgi:hypothetical protein
MCDCESHFDIRRRHSLMSEDRSILAGLRWNGSLARSWTAGAAGEPARAQMPVEAMAGIRGTTAPQYHAPRSGGPPALRHGAVAGVATMLEGEEESTARRIGVAGARHAIAHSSRSGLARFAQLQPSASQPIVDAAFLAQALLRARRTVLWSGTGRRGHAGSISAGHWPTTRTRKPHFNNWLLFAADHRGVSGARRASSGDRMRIDYALRQHEQWYLGDGVYGDGPELHWDYYNSFVIQPMLVDVLARDAAMNTPEWDRLLRAPVLARAQRYAAIQERLISPEGTFPADRTFVGLSLWRVANAGADGATRTTCPPRSCAQRRCAARLLQ